MRTSAYAVLGLFISTFVDNPASHDCVIVDAAAIAVFKAQHRVASTGCDAVELVEEDQRYNTHQYWREPLPELDVDEMMALLGQVSLNMQGQSSTLSPGETRGSPKTFPSTPSEPEEPEDVEQDLEQLLLTGNGCLRLPQVAERLVARPRCSGQPVRNDCWVGVKSSNSCDCTCSWSCRPLCWRRSKL